MKFVFDDFLRKRDYELKEFFENSEWKMIIYVWIISKTNAYSMSLIIIKIFIIL